MRTADRPLPTFIPVGAGDTILTWPAHVHLLMEGPTLPPYTWDSGRVYGDGSVWDARWLSSGSVDAICELAGVDVAHGGQDNNSLFPAGNFKATLIDPDGRYSQLNADGTLTSYQIGRYVSVLVEHLGVWYWIFSGRITRWDEQDTASTGTVTVEAFNVPAEMVPVGTFTPGFPGDLPGARLRRILEASGNAALVDGARLANGTVTLTQQPTDRSPWEEAQVAALSDGGWLFPDADDLLMYIDRTWVLGRDDQPSTVIFTDNECDDPTLEMVWNAVLSSNDDRLAGEVHLTNVAGLMAHARLPNDGVYPIRPTLTHSQPDQWTTQAEGNALAAFLLDRRYVARLSVSFQLYLHAPDRDLWQIGIDLRLGDRIRFRHRVRRPGGDGFPIDVGLIVNSLAHSISPSGWVVTVGTSTVVDYRPLSDVGWDLGRWDTDLWDDT